MRVNTDGVLLGAWMSLPRGEHLSLLDIGTGTGVIALMAAQRLAAAGGGFLPGSNSVLIDALEIDEESCNDAAENFSSAPWNWERDKISLRVRHCALQNYEQKESRYNLIFSNPPYFIDSLKPPAMARANARHADTLSQSEMIKHTLLLLKDGGKLALVLPAEEGEHFLSKINFLLESATRQAAGQQPLHTPVLVPLRLCKVYTTSRKNPKRYLMEFQLSHTLQSFPVCKTEELVIMDGEDYTCAYKELTKDFYLNF